MTNIVRNQPQAAQTPVTYTGAFSDTTTTALTATQIFAPASNPNGAYVEMICFAGVGASGGGVNMTLLAKAGTAPASSTDGDAIFKASTGSQNGIQAPAVPQNIISTQRIKIAANKGLYLNQTLISGGAAAHCEKSVLYTLL